jgi:hypothetical protein
MPDWARHLRAINLAPSTIDSYQRVGRDFLAYLEQQGMPTGASTVTREHVESYLADMFGRVSAATVAKHYRSLQQLWRWLVDDGEIQVSPMARMRPPPEAGPGRCGAGGCCSAVTRPVGVGTVHAFETRDGLTCTECAEFGAAAGQRRTSGVCDVAR